MAIVNVCTLKIVKSVEVCSETGVNIKPGK